MSKRGKGKTKHHSEIINPPSSPKADRSIDHTIIEDGEITDSFDISTHGYKLISKIIYNSSERGYIARYIKALNSYGETIYIYLDKAGHICTDGVCHWAERSDKAGQNFNSILDQETRDMLSDLSFDLFGVAIENKNNLSILTRNPDKPQDFESRHMEITFMTQLTTFYPVIKLSEIEEASTASLKAGSESFRKIRNKLLNKVTKESLSIHNKIADYYERSSEFIRKASDATINLSTIIKSLEKSCSELQQKQLTGSFSARDEDKYELTIYNLIDRHRLFEKLLNYHQQFSKLTVNDLDSINILIMKLDKDFSAIDKVHYPGSSIE